MMDKYGTELTAIGTVESSDMLFDEQSLLSFVEELLKCDRRSQRPLAVVPDDDVDRPSSKIGWLATEANEFLRSVISDLDRNSRNSL